MPHNCAAPHIMHFQQIIFGLKLGCGGSSLSREIKSLLSLATSSSLSGISLSGQERDNISSACSGSTGLLPVRHACLQHFTQKATPKLATFNSFWRSEGFTLNPSEPQMTDLLTLLLIVLGKLL